MSEITYNTDHGTFRIKRKNYEKAWAVLHDWAFEYPEFVERHTDEGLPPSTLAELFEYLGFGITIDENDDIVDLFLETSHFSEGRRQALHKLAPFVEEGSYLVFFGGGLNSCFGVSYRKNKQGKMEATDVDSVACVLPEDLQAMMKIIRASKPELFRQLHKSYGHLLKKAKRHG